MYELIFTFLVVTQSGLPGFHMERISRFKELDQCESTRTTMVTYMNSLVEKNQMFPGVFECRKIS